MSRRHPKLIGLGLLAAIAGSAAIATYAQAAFTAAGSASQTISSRNLVAPGSLTATPSGHDVALSWTAGSNGSGYQLLSAANGTSSNCTSASFAALTSTTGLTATDTGRYTPQGTYQCYQVKTTYNTWSSTTSNPTAAAQLGFVASSVAVTNGGTAGKLDAGDRIVVTYNQPVATATGPISTNKVCTNAASSGNIIMIGDAITSCNATTAVTVGAISTGTSTKTAAYSATWTWSAANTVLTVTIGTRTSGSADATITGSLTLSPTTTTTNMLSATGSYHNCDTNTGSGNCLPTVSGSF
jgi:hypothetical protein